MGKAEICGCGCTRPLLLPWHILAPECWEVASAEARAAVVRELAIKPGSREHVEALAAIVREVRKFRHWQAEVEWCRARGLGVLVD